MSDQFICISCWQEFKASAEDTKRRSGKVVCPRCGYIQPLPSDAQEESPANNSSAHEHHTQADPPQPSVVEEISWNTISAADDEEEDIPIGEEERTDRVEIPPELLSADWVHDVGMESDQADEKTPFEELAAPQPWPASMEDTSEDEKKQATTVDWQLKTPSGLTFKFTDPEAMLGWKKKISTYKELHVSPDGERWADFSRFVRQYEEIGDPLKAFILSASLSDSELPPPAPGSVEDELPKGALDEVAATKEAEAGAGKSGKKVGTTTAQFTFKVQDVKESGWGKYLVLALVGLVLGAGIVLAVLHLTGQIELPFDLNF